MSDYLKRIQPFVANFFLSGLFGTISLGFLYLRPTPFDLPYVLDTSHYLFHAIFYNWYGVALISAPFFLLLALWKTTIPPVVAVLSGVQVLLLFLSLVLGHVDGELFRHMGIRFSFEWLQTYDNTNGTPDAVWRSLAEDKGGAYSSFWLLLLPVCFVLSTRLLRRWPFSLRLKPGTARLVLAIGLVLFYLLPFFFRTAVFGGKNRQDKVKPPVILLQHEVLNQLVAKRTYDDIDNKILKLRSLWQSAEGASWRFSAKEYPFYKTPQTACLKSPTPMNVILIVLETFRAWNVQSFNPEHPLQSTPFIDALARDENSAYWTRCISNGHPTVFSFMAIQTSLFPHSQKTVTKAFPLVTLNSLPEILRNNGYLTAFFTGSDPDWDGQRTWLNRWYDKIHFNPSDEEQDRRVFRAASRFLREERDPNKPFLATLFSISNHIPFNSPEPNLNVYSGSQLKGKIDNTIHYTDDVVREFIESLRHMPWFDNTLVVITGDHGYDLGERGSTGGHENIRHETNWVPLIIFGGPNTALRGKQTSPTSHVDIAPTVLDMVGICDENAFMGHSLLTKRNENAFDVNVKSGNTAAETPSASFFFRANGEKYMYGASDLLQRQDMAAPNGSAVQDAWEKAQLVSEVTDYLYEHNRIAPKRPLVP